ncbi:MAG: GntR family transcriptional regulator, partial [Paracoccaceae bacterium]
MEPVYLRSLVDLSAERAEPLTVQLYRDLLAAIRAGRLGASSVLPSSRAGAAVLGLSRNTVNAAYDLLRAEVAVTIRRGAAPRVIGGIVRARPLRPVSGDVSLSARGEALAASGRGRMQSAVM